MIDSEIIYDKKITIFSDSSHFTIQKGDEIISIQKVQGLPISREERSKFGPGVRVHSIVGVIETKINSYLLGVTKALFVGNLLAAPIFKIEEVNS